MKIQILNADQDLRLLANSIAKHPLTWDGWSCLHIDIHAQERFEVCDFELWVNTVLKSYLGKAETWAYMRENQDIFVICKKVPINILQEAAEQINNLIVQESGLYVESFVYDLEQDFVSFLMGVNGNENDNLEIVQKDQDRTSKTIQNYRDYANVLLVEDDAVACWMVENALKHHCHLKSAGSASKAFLLFKESPPDIVFLDINLPDQSGYEVLEWIKSKNPDAYVVMFSGNDSLENITHALKEGAEGFIPKPFLKEHLLHYIHNHKMMAYA